MATKGTYQEILTIMAGCATAATAERPGNVPFEAWEPESIERVELVMDVEKALSIELPDKVWDGAATVGDMAQRIVGHLNGGDSA